MLNTMLNDFKLPGNSDIVCEWSIFYHRQKGNALVPVTKCLIGNIVRIKWIWNVLRVVEWRVSLICFESGQIPGSQHGIFHALFTQFLLPSISACRSFHPCHVWRMPAFVFCLCAYSHSENITQPHCMMKHYCIPRGHAYSILSICSSLDCPHEC